MASADSPPDTQSLSLGTELRPDPEKNGPEDALADRQLLERLRPCQEVAHCAGREAVPNTCTVGSDLGDLQEQHGCGRGCCCVTNPSSDSGAGIGRTRIGKVPVGKARGWNQVHVVGPLSLADWCQHQRNQHGTLLPETPYSVATCPTRARVTLTITSAPWQ